jgi:putative ABC transport system permease protein
VSGSNRVGRFAFRVLLLLFPRRYRRRYGRDLVNDFWRLIRAARTDRGRMAAVMLWGRALAELVVQGAKERVASLRYTPFQGSSGRGGPRRAPLASLAQDVRFALRSFIRNPWFSTVTVVTLGLGIGATTAIFSVVDGVLLRPLPYPESQRLVKVGIAIGGLDNISLANPVDFFNWRAGNTTFESMAATVSTATVLLGRGEPERLSTPAVSAGFFSVLGVPPLLGRGIQPSDDQPGAPRVVVLSHGLWQRRWGGDSTVLGTTVTLSGEPYTIVGVMPAWFRSPQTLRQGNAQAWIPLASTGVDLEDTQGLSLQIVGRLAPLVDLARAREDLVRLGTVLPASDTGVDFWPGAASLHGETVKRVSTTLTTLLGAVGLLLLIACANVANLFLARGTDRGREVAMRAALGAGRGRIVRQLLTESLVLALVGGIFGIVLAALCVQLFVAFDPGNVPRLGEVGVNGRVLGFALATATVTGVLFGTVPAARATRGNLTDALRDWGGITSGRGTNRLRSAFVVMQTALALMLTVGAGLMLNSFIRLHMVDPGFDPQGVAVLEVVPGRGYPTMEARTAFFGELLAGVQAIPGVEAAAVTSTVPLRGPIRFATVFPEEYSRESDSLLFTGIYYVSEGYFEAMGIPIVRGRSLRGGRDVEVVVSEAFVRKYWPSDDPIGKRIVYSRSGWPDAGDPQYTVVGVAGNVKTLSLDRGDSHDIYVSYRTPEANFGGMLVVARARERPVAADLRQVVWTLDSGLPLDAVELLEERVAASIASPRFYAWLFATFATIALVLASVGIYGATAYAAGQRVRELGLRKALGADTGDVLRLVVRRGLAVIATGLALGIAGAVGASRVLSSLLFGVTPTDPATLLAVAGVLAAVGAAACYIPSRRTAGVDPMTVLRDL